MALGVDASMLAPQLGLTVEELFGHNRAGTLYLACRVHEPAHGGTRAITYRFRVGQAEAALTFEEGVPEARA
jgi:hypothetical protein